MADNLEKVLIFDMANLAPATRKQDPACWRCGTTIDGGEFCADCIGDPKRPNMWSSARDFREWLFRGMGDLQEVPAMPAFFSCGCSHHKVKMGMCDIFDKDGNERPVEEDSNE